MLSSLTIGIAATVAVGFVLSMVIVGAVITAKRRKKSSCYALDSVGVNMPPLINGNTNAVSCAIQPDAEQIQVPVERSYTIPFKFWKRHHDQVDQSQQKANGVKDGYLGKINFTLGYDRDTFSFQIHLREAVDLPAKDFLTGSSDPYIRAMLLPDYQEIKVSKVHRRCRAPKFNQTLEFKGISLKRLLDMTMCIQVIDYDRFSHDDPIGEVLLPLKDIKLDRKPCYWKHLMVPTVHHKLHVLGLCMTVLVALNNIQSDLPFQALMNGTVKGELMLSVCYLPESDRLTVVVIKAKDLPAKDMNGSSDPYVKLWLVHQGVKCEKKKTTTKMQTLLPVYNETFTFIVPKDKVPEMQLVASVMDYDLIGGNDEIGHVVLGMRGSETGQKHWRGIVDQPGYPVAMWHSLSTKM